jgi:hypothetical protein
MRHIAAIQLCERIVRAGSVEATLKSELEETNYENPVRAAMKPLVGCIAARTVS